MRRPTGQKLKIVTGLAGDGAAVLEERTIEELLEVLYRGQTKGQSTGHVTLLNGSGDSPRPRAPR